MTDAKTEKQKVKEITDKIEETVICIAAILFRATWLSPICIRRGIVFTFGTQIINKTQTNPWYHDFVRNEIQRKNVEPIIIWHSYPLGNPEQWI